MGLALTNVESSIVASAISKGGGTSLSSTLALIYCDE